MAAHRLLRWPMPAAVRCLVIAAAVVPTHAASPQVGRLGILVDVHGYRTPGGVVVPLRGIAEWMGAQVDFRAPRVTIRLRGRNVALTLGARTARVNGATVRLSVPARSYDGVTCVPIRFVAEGLGAEVTYRAGRNDAEVERMAGAPFAQVRSGGRECRVVVHGAPPGTVAGIIRANGRGYGRDWLICEFRPLPHGYVWTSDPYGWEPGQFGGRDGFLCEGDNGVVWRRSGAGWREVGRVGLDDQWDEDLIRAGVPRDVVRQIEAAL